MALSFFQKKKKKEKCNRPILGRPTHTDVGLVSFIVFSSSVVVNGGGGEKKRREEQNKPRANDGGPVVLLSLIADNNNKKPVGRNRHSQPDAGSFRWNFSPARRNVRDLIASRSKHSTLMSCPEG